MSDDTVPYEIYGASVNAMNRKISALHQEVERLREALGWIRDLAPATMEVTVASQMADIATEALAKGQTP